MENNNIQNDDALVQKSRPLFSLWKEKENISLFEYKMLDKYLSKINSHDPEKRTVSFSLEDIHEIISAHLTKAELQKKLKKLQSLVVSYGDDAAVTLFEYSKIHIDDKHFEVELMCTQTAHKYFFNIETIGYFKYKFRNILELTSMYSYILFNFLEMNRFRNQPFEIELSELKQILNCDTQTYDEFKYFNRQILRKCYNEIINKTELQYSYEPVRVNRIIQRIRFNVFPSKRIDELIRDYEECDLLESKFPSEEILSFETDKESSADSNSEPENISDKETENSDSIDERTRFFSDCFDDTFTAEQVQYLTIAVNEECMAETGYGLKMDKFNYLRRMYKRFCVEEKERDIKNRFKYFLTMIENDKAKLSAENTEFQ